MYREEPKEISHSSSNGHPKQYLVVNGLIKILDKYIALPGLAEGGVALRPHDTTSATFNKRIVELIQGMFT